MLSVVKADAAPLGKMDPELAKIRRERYLAHKRDAGATAEAEAAGRSSANASNNDNDEEVIILLDSDDEHVERKPSSEKPALRNDDSDADSVECLSGPLAKKRPRNNAPSEGARHRCRLDKRSGSLRDAHPRVKDEG